MNKLFARIAPAFSILALTVGFGFYLYSAACYSTATTGDPINGGYHHFRSYWCELYVPVTYTGQSNAGVSAAKVSTLALVASLFFFFLCMPVLFAEYVVLKWIIRIAGIIASAAASLIFTDLHDIVITLAVPLGFAAVIAVCIGLARKRLWLLLNLAIVAVAVGSTDYTAWKLGIWKDTQPIIQKSAFVLIFLWVVLGALKVLWQPPKPALEFH